MYVATSETITRHEGNCTMVALRQILPLSVTDEEIERVCIANGFKNGEGMRWRRFFVAAEALGVEYDKTLGTQTALARDCADPSTRHLARYDSITTLGRAVSTGLRHGTWIVGVQAHVLVVRDGVIVDPNYRRRAARRRVYISECARVLNDGWTAPAATTGLLRFARTPWEAKRRGTASYRRYAGAYNLTLGGRDVSEAEILATGYTRADLAHDLQAGHVRRV